LSESSGVITGTLDFPQGSLPITSGTSDASGVTIKATIPGVGEITLKGKVNGNQITGSVDSPQGGAPFTATRSQ
jgi:hypothetical protein